MSLRYRLFTHNDLDGVGCSIALKSMYNATFNVNFCNYHEINDQITDFFKSGEYEQYDRLFITDIGITVDTANLIQAHVSREHIPVFMVDHHPTNLNLNHYEFCNILPNHNNGMKSSATSLLLELLIYEKGVPVSSKLKQFSEIVRKYDTWDWQRIGDIVPKRYNDLLTIIGLERFEKLMLNLILDESTQDLELPYAENMMIEIHEEEVSRYILDASRRLVKTVIDGHKVGVVFAERFASKLGNDLCKMHPDIDYVMIINLNYENISLRATREDIHVGEISKALFGGGGHAQAAGAQLSREDVLRIQNVVTGHVQYV